MGTHRLVRRSLVSALLLVPSCSNPKTVGATDAGSDAAPVEASACAPRGASDGSPGSFCDLPGSVVYGAAGARCVVGGGPASAPSLTWLTLPTGFCAHYFGHVPTARQVRVAPGGELFVASPSTYTAGGAPAGVGAIVVLYDDDGDGFADGDALPHADGSAQKLTVFAHVASTQGLGFTPGSFYYQDGTRILKLPYAAGDRSPKGSAKAVIDISPATGGYISELHWPKAVDVADDGTVYVGNGGDQGELCDPAVFPRPVHGGIFQVDGTSGGSPIAQGFRNPIALRCAKGHNLCFATELALDGSGGEGGREKIVPIRKGDDWGYPCCATQNTPYATAPGSPNCSTVASEDVALEIGDTPFGLDFEGGRWPAPFTNAMLVTLHGQVSTWTGARVLAVPMLPNGMPARSSDLPSSTVPDFATGWDDGTHAHGRPAAVTFSADGRAYVANDVNGDVFWVAPAGLSRAR